MKKVIAGEDFATHFTEFLNGEPLYSRFEVQFTHPKEGGVDLPRTILRECKKCRSPTTWGRVTDGVDVGAGEVLRWFCMLCGKEDLHVWISLIPVPERGRPGRVAGVIFRKLGQWPSQRVEAVSEVEKALPPRTLEMYEKGLTSLSHGFGLAAVSYFRRVVEDATGAVLDLVIEAAEAEGDMAQAERVRELKGGKVAADKLKEAAKHLPASLRPGGRNPLDLLHDRYSAALHGLSDAECLEIAQGLHATLEHVFRRWRTRLDEDQSFREGVKALTVGSEPS